MNRRTCLKVLGGVALLGVAESLGLGFAASGSDETFEVNKTDEQWRAILTPDQYRVLRRAETEPPFKNKYHDAKAKGTYLCAGCALPLFSSAAKFDSHTGWPSFWEPISPSAVRTKTDYKLIYPRTEVHCARCGGHLGHLFEKEGPPPTYLRYCINSAALAFGPEEPTSP